MEYYVTRAGKAKLEQKRSDIREGMFHLTLSMGASAERDDDLRENPEFLDLRYKAMYQHPQLVREIGWKCEKAIIIEDTPEYIMFNGTTVIRGSEVVIEFQDGEKFAYKILGSDEGDLSQNILSCDASLAKAVLGKKVNEVIPFNNEKIKIVSVKRL